MDRVKEGRTLIREIQRRKGIWLGHNLMRSGILTVTLDGSVKDSVMRERRRKLDKKGKSWKLL